MSALGPMSPTATRRRRRPPALLLLGAVLVAGVVAGLLLAAGGSEPLAPGRGPGADPLAYRSDQEATLQQRAARGLSHVLYAKSPGGAVATAARVARFRPRVDAAARRYGAAPDMLEAIVLLGSAGRPGATASSDVSGAAGLTQILAGTATSLLGMHVDLASSKRLTKLILRADRKGRMGAAALLRARRRRVDDRFDPAKALSGTGRYLQFARGQLGGRNDLAVESYHMGVGNLQGALRAYGGGNGVSYTRLYFDSTPLRHADAYGRLAALGDDSSTYLWRVLAAREIMRLYRQNPAELTRLAALHARKATAEEVLHPLASTRVFATPAAVAAARASGQLRSLPANAADLFLRIDPGMGQLAPRLHRRPSLYRALRPESLAVLVYIAAGVHEISGESPL
ncbi:MAG: hypothetical protein QOC95_914, partial [Thermoleophilaceae bacterium]|nr:hypothetical protein [Thermoleophilaceae bacterium]